jgi:hypothetical protein
MLVVVGGIIRFTGVGVAVVQCGMQTGDVKCKFMLPLLIFTLWRHSYRIPRTSG